MDSREKRKSKHKNKRSGRSKSNEAKNSVPYIPLTEESEVSDYIQLECTLEDVFLPQTTKFSVERVSTPSSNEKNGAAPQIGSELRCSISPVPKSKKGELSPGFVEISPLKDNTNSATKSKSPFSPRRETKLQLFDDNSSEMKPLVDNMEALPVARSKLKSPLRLVDFNRPTMSDFYERQSVPEGPEPPDVESTSQSNLSESSSITNATEALDIADSSSKTSKRKQHRLKKIIKKSLPSYRALLDEASSQNSSEESETSRNTRSKLDRRRKK